MANGTVRFDAIDNFRDVGAYLSTISPARLRKAQLYRSARLSHATPSDLSTLDSLEIHTILDLRTSSEARATPNATTPRIRTLHISLTGLRFRLRLLWRLSWPALCQCSWAMLCGRQLDAVRLLGDSMGARGLAGMAADTLEASWVELRAVFETLAGRGAWPVLVHCAQGKDRTGLVVLLLERLAGVEVEACTRDYMLSQTELESGRDERLEETRRYGLPDVFADCEEGWVEGVVAYIDERWGGVEGYLAWCGVSDEQVQAVKDILTEH